MAENKGTSVDSAILRQKAEELLAAKEDALPSMSADEIRKTVHALHTHQIELELQNDSLRHAQEDLLVSQKKYNDLYDFAPVGYLTISDTGLIIEANLTAARMLTMERAALLRKPLTPFFCTEEQDQHYLCRSRLLASKEDQCCERRIIRKDGSEFDALCRCVTRPEIDGDSGQFRMVMTDISEQKQAKREQARLEMQLRQSNKMQAVGTLAGGIAHEFNNILGIIMGYADLSRELLPKDHVVKGHLDKVLVASNRAKTLIQQLLTFSRKSQHKRLATALQPVVREAISLIEPSLPASVEVKVELTPTPLNVLVEPTEIQQIVMNVCANAVWAMREKGRLEIRLQGVELAAKMAKAWNLPAGHYACLSFQDSGAGMDKEILARIFDPFFTTKGVGQGTGMGLSIIHGIMENYGGKIMVESEVGQGSTFHFYFPLTTVPEAKPAGETPVNPGQGEHILFVDDEKLYGEMMSEMLTKLGYHVDFQSNGLDALAAFKASPDRYDLVITDQIMPNLSGDDLIKQLRALRPTVPIILCTGYSSHIDAKKVKALEINAFTYKPLSKEVLARLIRKVLGD